MLQYTSMMISLLWHSVTYVATERPLILTWKRLRKLFMTGLTNLSYVRQKLSRIRISKELIKFIFNAYVELCGSEMNSCKSLEANMVKFDSVKATYG